MSREPDEGSMDADRSGEPLSGPNGLLPIRGGGLAVDGANQILLSRIPFW